ncbi:SARP family transcriptional regulator [Streptomyces yunnanensis]|uniref:SARP family transcriptional regulator n=1 Tax=Streptomyces yunnanensis TaxID=156453 RepID=A0ABY8A1B0_9ACTN|nr:BTAD domain-containing putative transcriptional regulator [Streptomyces yunnanensis]WEB38464.1 SARP family transcriptional regulator [Streptomyces yunnanensis]
MSRSTGTELGVVRDTPADHPPEAGGTRHRPPPPRSRGARVELLGGFRLVTDDDPARIPAGSERLLAFVALRYGAVPRGLVAESLWPDVSECRAYASLRSALNRLRCAGCGMLDVGPGALALAGGVGVDFRELKPLAHLLVDSSVASPGTSVCLGLGASEIDALSQDLLPGWCDEWALREAEEWRQLRMHALEALATRFIRAQHFGHAVCAAGAAVRAEPLRETARAVLIKAHLAEGNQSEALREFQRYRSLLQAELGLRPTSRLLGLVADLRSAASRCAACPATYREPVASGYDASVTPR